MVFIINTLQINIKFSVTYKLCNVPIWYFEIFHRHRKPYYQKVDIENNELLGDSIALKCDLILMSGGWNPAVQLFSQSRGKLKYDSGINSFVPKEFIKNQKVL